jgi:hypothetical protein
MALNKFMHRRNPFYGNPPDFRQLAQLYPEFEKYCVLTNEKCDINFKDPDALKCLACVLLKHLYSKNILEYFFNYFKKIALNFICLRFKR